MKLVVKKFGGSSVATIDKIQKVAQIIRQAHDAGNKVVAVVSAMGNTTDELQQKIDDIYKNRPNGSNFDASMNSMAAGQKDAVLAAGEQVSAGLLALELINLGVRAQSLCGWQVPIISNNIHGCARIEAIDSTAIHKLLQARIVPVIAGFQGVHDNKITTFGRGGSDTTAVAVASAIGADECLIYTDVEGIYTSDPKKVANAQIVDEISYEECLEVAASGGKVIHPRAVEIGLRNSFNLKILPTSNPHAAGTTISNNKSGVESDGIAGVSVDEDQVLITLEGIENVPGVASAIFSQLQDIDINADLIVQNISHQSNYSDLSFTVKERDKAIAINALQNINHVAYSGLSVLGDVAKISVVGIGLKRYSNIAKKMFETLAKQGINILLVSTSEIKISVLVRRSFAQIGLNALHKEFINNKQINNG